MIKFVRYTCNKQKLITKVDNIIDNSITNFYLFNILFDETKDLLSYY